MIDAVLKNFITLFVMLMVPVYWKNYGPGNFLWLSDISLFLTLWVLWFKSPLVNSVIVLAILPVEIAWMADFFFQLATGETLFNIASYMFDPQKSKFLRGLSSFHLFLPPIWLWYLYKWGYDKRSFKFGTLLVWCAFVLSYLLTSPEENINWVYYPQKFGLDWIHPLLWLLGLMAIFPLFIYWPVHKALERLCKEA